MAFPERANNKNHPHAPQQRECRDRLRQQRGGEGGELAQRTPVHVSEAGGQTGSGLAE